MSLPDTVDDSDIQATMAAVEAATEAAVHDQTQAMAATAREAQEHAEYEQGLQRSLDPADGANPLKRALEMAEDDENRLKMARLDQEDQQQTDTTASATAAAALQHVDMHAHLNHSDPAAAFEGHGQVVNHTPSPMVANATVAQIHSAIPSHTATPIQTSEVSADQNQNNPPGSQFPQIQSTEDQSSGKDEGVSLESAQIGHSESQQQSEVSQQAHSDHNDVMNFMAADVARRAVEASDAVAASPAIAQVPTAPMATTGLMEIPTTVAPGHDDNNSLGQSQMTQSIINGHAPTSPTAMGMDVDGVHHQANVAIQEAGKDGAPINYSNQLIQNGSGSMAISSTPSRPVAFSVQSPQSHAGEYSAFHVAQNSSDGSNASPEKPYGCNQCDMRFRRLHDLKRHGKLHTGEKPHVCPKCDRKFARGDALARHSKGIGGCAARRASMNNFIVNEGLEGHSMLDEEGAMNDVVYNQSNSRAISGQTDVRYHDGPFHDSRVAIQLQSATAPVARETGTAPAPQPVGLGVSQPVSQLYGTVGLGDKDLDQATAETQRGADGKAPATASVGLNLDASVLAAGTATNTPVAATVTAASIVGATSATAAATTAGTPAAAPAVPVAPATATTDSSMNMFASSNAAIWTYVFGLEERVAAVEKADKEKAAQIATMEKHITLLLTQLAQKGQ